MRSRTHGARLPGDYKSIAIGTSGAPVIAYNDASFYALKVYLCGSSTCRPAPSSWLAPLSGYVHAQVLPVELPSAFTLYSKTPAMPFNLANFSELVWKWIVPR